MHNSIDPKQYVHFLQENNHELHFAQNLVPDARIKQQTTKAKLLPISHQSWQHSFWPNTTTNQQSCGTSLSEVR
jgi:CHASE1-domain containing sensor protein